MKINSAYISKQKCIVRLAVFYGVVNRLRIIEPLRGRINQLHDWKVKSSDNVVSVISPNPSCNLLLLVPFSAINEVMEANRCVLRVEHSSCTRIIKLENFWPFYVVHIPYVSCVFESSINV